MARAVTIGNGNILVGLDYRGQVRDFYFPQVGHTNHVSGASGSYVHRMGVFVDGVMTWLDAPGWEISIRSKEDSLIGEFTATHKAQGVTITSRDAVHNEHNVFLRHIAITNLAAEPREIKFFISQQFRINESRRGDTAMFDPRVGAVIHYKGNEVFLVNAMQGGKQFSEYNIGLFGIEGKEGTYFDAEDGILEKNPIEHGSVDSVIGFTCVLPADATEEIYYWIACAHSVPEAHTLDELVIAETPERLIASTDAYWHTWLNKEERDFSAISPALRRLYQRSLLTIRAHTDNRGGIIASSDTDMLHHGRDTYSYVWPRDGAVIAHALDVAGYTDAVQRFFSFMAACQEPQGYLMHKYRTDGALGSSWHPWMQRGEPSLPIQEDETAAVIVMLWRHYEINRDIEFIEEQYNAFIEPAAQFLCEYIESTTGLPQASYDLWEEKYGTSTYTSAAVYGALMASARFASLLGKDNDARTYQAIAQRLQHAIGEHLYDAATGMFVKHVLHVDGELEYDRTIDTSSIHGLILFDVFDIDDERIISAIKVVERELQVTGNSKGFVRYQHDSYYTRQDAGSPNPWVITTLWIAQYYIKRATSEADLMPALELLEWTCSHATDAGTLAEQMHPHTREHLSTAPLVWSHAEYVLTVDAYLKKVAELTAAE